MRLVALSWWLPCPPDNGSRIRAFYLLRELARRHELHLLSFAERPWDEPGLAPLREFCASLVVLPRPVYAPRSAPALRGLLSPLPRSLVAVASPAMAVALDRAAASHRPDLVLGLQHWSLPYLRRPPLRHLPRVVDELEPSVMRPRAEQSWLGRARAALTWWKFRRYLAGALAELQGVTCVSEPELACLQAIAPSGTPLALVPNGVDTAHYRFSDGPREAGALLYHGALTYRPNRDAVGYFAREILPLVRQRAPEAVLRVTGATTGVAGLDDLAGAVELTGYLPDLRPLLARSRACVVPLRQGGGTRLKILEAMAAGTPVVSTRKGAEGLAVVDGEHLLLADDPAGFAAAVVRLLRDEELARRLARNARALVEERYDWAGIAATFDAFLCQVAGDVAPRPVLAVAR